MPTNIHQEFDYLKGIGPDGTVLPQYYAPGDPLTKTGALDDTLVVNFFDRAMILALPVQDLVPNETKCFDFAYVFAQGQNHKQSLELLRQYCDEIKADYDSVGSTYCSIAQFLGASNHELNQPKIYPNPVLDYLSVELEHQNLTDGQITITNQHGQTLFVVDVVQGESVQRIDVSELPTGVYFIEVKSKYDRSILKFIKI